MSTSVWPYLPPDELKKAEEDSVSRELSWLLDELQETLLSLKLGLEECCALLEPKEPGSTLVMSTPRTEYVKGHVTRVGGNIVRGSLNLRLHTYPHTSLSLTPRVPTLDISTMSTIPTPLPLPPLLKLRALLSSALDCIVVTRLEGDRQSASFISSQLRLLHGILLEALALLKGPTSLRLDSMPPSRPSSAIGNSTGRQGRSDMQPVQADTPGKSDADDLSNDFDLDEEEPWNLSPIAASTFHPNLPPNLSITLTPSSSTLILTVRVLEPADQQPNLGSRLALAIGAQRRIEHDEMDAVVNYRGKEVRVREKVRVRSSVDPELLVLGAKLGSLERILGGMRGCLGVVMSVSDD